MPFGIYTAPSCTRFYKIIIYMVLSYMYILMIRWFLVGRFKVSYLQSSFLDQIQNETAAFNVRLEPSKWFFSIKFLGHIFDENEVGLSESIYRVQGIWGLLETMSIVNYFRDLSKDFRLISSYHSTHQEKCFRIIFWNDCRIQRFSCQGPFGRFCWIGHHLRRTTCCCIQMPVQRWQVE